MVDFTNDKCPICNNQFKKDDDIVVCPSCGTPHHRNCYNDLGHCEFNNLHSEGYVWKRNNVEEQSNKTCPFCGQDNPKDSIFCSNCGFSFTNNKANDNSNYDKIDITDISILFDPLAGVNPNEKIDDEVTMSDIAEFVQQSSRYYVRTFKNIKDNNLSKFNFSAFLFTGGWLLYRKQYKIGSIVTCIMAILSLLYSYITFKYSNTFSSLMTGSLDINILYTAEGKIALYLSIIKLVIMFIFGFKANKIYMKHCIAKIKSIKHSCNSKENINQILSSKGGVNTSIAILMLVIYFIIDLMPNLFIK